MLAKCSWLLVLLASLFVANKYNYLQEINIDFVHKGLNTLGINIPGIYQNSKRATERTNSEERLFTVGELKKYTNAEHGLYISILGNVFDVTKGAKHYAPGASYHGFTGRDASLAFITGEFNSNSITDDVSSLSVGQVRALTDWIKFYKDNYIYKGKLIGRFYDEDGHPTHETYKVHEKAILAQKENFLEEERKKIFPPCNVEWNAETGTVIWCSKRSGGIERDWVGVPRMFATPGTQQYRCACVNLDSKEYEEFKGSFREYAGCSSTSPKCVSVKLDKL